MRKLAVLIVLLLLATGCFTKEQPVVQPSPILTVVTDNVPQLYAVPEAPRPPTEQPDENATIAKPPAIAQGQIPHGQSGGEYSSTPVGGGGGGWYYYTPPVVIAKVIIYQGTGVIIQH